MCRRNFLSSTVSFFSSSFDVYHVLHAYRTIGLTETFYKHIFDFFYNTIDLKVYCSANNTCFQYSFLVLFLHGNYYGYPFQRLNS